MSGSLSELKNKEYSYFYKLELNNEKYFLKKDSIEEVLNYLLPKDYKKQI